MRCRVRLRVVDKPSERHNSYYIQPAAAATTYTHTCGTAVPNGRPRSRGFPRVWKYSSNADHRRIYGRSRFLGRISHWKTPGLRSGPISRVHGRERRTYLHSMNKRRIRAVDKLSVASGTTSGRALIYKHPETAAARIIIYMHNNTVVSRLRTEAVINRIRAKKQTRKFRRRRLRGGTRVTRTRFK